jgi:hypothetical protein
MKIFAFMCMPAVAACVMGLFVWACLVAPRRDEEGDGVCNDYIGV